MQNLKGFLINSIRSCWSSSNLSNVTNFSTFTQPLCIQMTPALFGEPLKKKKKADPAMVKIREERKRRRLWKDCRRLMRLQKQLKPIDEIDIPYVLIDERQARLRKKPVLSTETLNERADLMRLWTNYRNKRTTTDFYMIDRMFRSRDKALQQLKSASPRLYEEAIKIDETSLPITLNGPTFTPPIKNYDSPDGEYIDATRKWDPPKVPVIDSKKFTKQTQPEKNEE